MRSRYTAFVLRRPDHLLRTWHSSTRPAPDELAQLATDRTVWRRLQIVDTVDGDSEAERGIVEFRATYRTDVGVDVLHERSTFVREAGQWRYLTGDLLAD